MLTIDAPTLRAIVTANPLGGFKVILLDREADAEVGDRAFAEWDDAVRYAHLCLRDDIEEGIEADRANAEARAEANARREVLSRAFDLVSDPNDWRAPIRRFVTCAALSEAGVTIDDVEEAVDFFTATAATIEPSQTRPGVLDGYDVDAVGYRAGPAGP